MSKEELAEKVGMQFDEAAELFSEETLNSMLMTHIVGGTEAVNVKRCKENCSNCDQCKCEFNNYPDSCNSTPSSTPAPTTPTP